MFLFRSWGSKGGEANEDRRTSAFRSSGRGDRRLELRWLTSHIYAFLCDWCSVPDLSSNCQIIDEDLNQVKQKSRPPLRSVGRDFYFWPNPINSARVLPSSLKFSKK